MERERTANDRPAALDAKYDPKEFLEAYDTEEVIRRLQQERGLDQGDRALKGKVGMDIGSPERSSNYM
jgi:hypothetical protein